MIHEERPAASEGQEPGPPATPRHHRGLVNHPATRLGILFLVLVGLVYLVTYTAIRVISSSFATRSARHLEREVARFREQIAADEAQLDTEAGHVVHELATTPNITRTRLFQIVSLHCIGNRRGIRVLAPNGNIVAWAGETLPVPGNVSYEFDATNLYVVRSNPTPQGIVQAYERISNEPRSRSLLDPDDDWISSTIFHAGSLRQEPGSRRFIL